ncbi:MAG: tetratricopeptide repeat protein [Deltaproteobacteria bacterium]|nr:tetratricopeptide repeat protein [Deltaproteobacteria bacterium]
MSQRPTGTVTFLFTDVEGSTQLWERHPGWMAGAHARQESLLRAAFAAHGGYPYKMIGDAFQVAFAKAPAAIAAAADAQRALAAEPWGEPGEIRVRMALHTGETEERGDDYVGPLLNRVARLMSAAHGGQVLLSYATHELIRERLPSGTTLRDLGERRLRDLSRPERVHQLVIEGVRDDFPPLKTLDALPNNLPLKLTHFIGRERALAEVAELLARARLVTLTGTGGTGKTRLSLQLAGDVMERFEHGVWFVELAPHTDEQEVPRAVATALGIVELPGKPVTEVLGARLAGEERLVVLDNCEHVIGAAAELAATLLRASPRSRIIATSREPLRLAGEVTYGVPPLSMPAPGDAVSVASAAASEAVRLFADRAASVSPGFALDAGNARVVAELCRRLDGIPLAIELAAARVRTLSLDKIAERLNDRFRLLSRGERVALPRQQTLRALIDWSYDLLSEPERQVFRRLAAFAGGFTLAAAESVCAGDGVDAEDVIDLVANLVEKSLVVVDPGGERYHFLETIREYAAERLGADPEANAIRERHLGHYLEWADRLSADAGTCQDDEWRSLDAEHDNFLAALASCDRTEGRAESGLRLVLALRDYWWSRGLLELGLQHSLRALERPGAEQPTRLRARVLAQLPWMSIPLGRYAEAQAQARASLEIARAIGADDCATNALRMLGISTYMCGDVEGGLRHCEEALVLAERLADPRPRQAAIMALAEIHRHARRLDRAEPLYHQSLAVARESGDRINISLNLVNLAMVCVSRGKLDQAREHLAEVLAVVAEAGVRTTGQVALDVCSALADVRGEWEVAARIFGASEAHRLRLGSQREPVDDEFLAPHLARTRAALGDERFAAAEAGGRALVYEDALAEARRWLAGH